MASPPPPTLLLTIEQGPRAGETIHCTPVGCGTSVRIGRVIRGNTFTIKDPAISQKHLAIEHVGGSGWVVTDLDTSNGTFLNSATIVPLVPTPLKHGDLLKIGGNTTIAVVIAKTESRSEEQEVWKARVTRSRRYETRSGAVQATGSDTTAGNEKNKNAGGARRRGRARARAAADPIVESEAREVDQTGKADVGAEVNDPEKMTVGEWLDSVEKYLPMVIKDIADEMIADLRERARRFNDFISERARQQAASSRD